MFVDYGLSQVTGCNLRKDFVIFNFRYQDFSFIIKNIIYFLFICLFRKINIQWNGSGIVEVFMLCEKCRRDCFNAEI